MANKRRCRRGSKGRFIKKETPSNVRPFRIFDLPPELRNDIYRYVVVSPGRIELTGDARMQPPLLRASRQIRNEAISVFDFTHYDGASMEPLWKNINKYRSKTVHGNVYGHQDGPAEWINLYRWIEVCSRSMVPAALKIGKPGREYQVVVAAFDLFEAHRKRPWVEIERILEGFHAGIMAIDGAWA